MIFDLDEELVNRMVILVGLSLVVELEIVLHMEKQEELIHMMMLVELIHMEELEHHKETLVVLDPMVELAHHMVMVVALLVAQLERKRHCN